MVLTSNPIGPSSLAQELQRSILCSPSRMTTLTPGATAVAAAVVVAAAAEVAARFVAVLLD